MKIYSNKKNKQWEKTNVLGLSVYNSFKIKGGIEKRYLYGLFKTKEIKCTTTFYILGIRIFKKDDKFKVLSLQLKELQKRLDSVNYNVRVLSKVPSAHKYLEKYRGCNSGKDIILFAGGPTVKYYNNEIKNAVKCGVNGIFSTIPDLNYLFLEDYFVWDKTNTQNRLADEYVGNHCEKFYGILPEGRLTELNKRKKFTERILPENIINANANIFLLEDKFMGSWAIEIESEPFGDFGGSVFSALQFLLYTNPRKIYLCGNDCSSDQNVYLSDDAKTNCHYFKIPAYKNFKNFAERIYPSTEIISINPVGLRGIFRDVYTQSYLDANSDLKDELGDYIEIIGNEYALWG